MTDLATLISAKLANDYGLFPPMEWIETEHLKLLTAETTIAPTATLVFMLAKRWQSRQAPIFTKVDL